ncbi:resolvase [Pandoraea sputorum]|uniref:Resolvase n=1 Tax=Pandoraea sputorum TaxID=93222 RepID=A0A5E5BEL4_9BURK|nr:recombinase family protein [Pandoraea sputorum]VVE84621.1 resolvase [Pandoraea sputorum]
MRDPADNATRDVQTGAFLIGYARVATRDQDPTNQEALLRAPGCGKIFAEKFTGMKRARPQLERLLDHLRAGDIRVVTRLDRLARSIRELLEIVERIRDAGAGLRSLAEPWADTTTSAGRMVLTVFGGMAKFERGLIVERLLGGLASIDQPCIGS